MPTIHTIVATYNGLQWIDYCFGSLKESGYPVHIIAVDNGSDDGTPEAIRTRYPEVELIELGDNLGFGPANNIGIKRALEENADYIFLLNLDARVDAETIGILLEAAKKNPSYGIISPMHLNGAGTGLDFAFSTYIEPLQCPDLYSDIYMGSTKEMYKVNSVNAAAWFMNVDMIRNVGLFDELFFVYGVDDNYVDRVSFHGYGIGVVPTARIYHAREDRGAKKIDVKTKYDTQINRGLVIAMNPNMSLSSKILKLKRKSFSDMFGNLQNGNIPAIWGNAKSLCKGLYHILIYDKRYGKTGA